MTKILPSRSFIQAPISQVLHPRSYLQCPRAKVLGITSSKVQVMNPSIARLDIFYQTILCPPNHALVYLYIFCHSKVQKSWVTIQTPSNDRKKYTNANERCRNWESNSNAALEESYII